MFKACIFDLDGTLANTLNSIAYFANNALKKHNLPEIPTEHYRYHVGDGEKNLIIRMLSDVGANEEEYLSSVRSLYNKSYDDNFLYLTEAYEGIIPLLSSLKEKGMKLAVLSNKPHETTYKIVNTLFPDTFDVVYGKREGYPIKPDPKSVFEILEELHVSSAETMYFGDTKTDMLTGKGAGIFTVGVTWGFRDEAELKANGADVVVKCPDEILGLLRQEN